MTLFKELLKKIRNIALNELDKRFVRKHRGYEINKAKDDRREQIRKTIALSEQDIKNIDGLYGISYGEKIPYDWHLLYTAYTGNFDVNYFPELLYIPEFEHFENPYSNYQVVYEDKNVLSLIARGLGVGIPRTICSRMAGMYRDDNYCQCDLKDVVNAIRVLGEVFVKPTIESGSGRGCTVLQVGGV